ncbi:MAG: ATP-binding protein [Chloroflexota bacterium]
MEKRLLFTAVTLNHLAQMRQFIEQSGKALGAHPEIVADSIVAVNEATTNIIIHGYGEQLGDIEIVVKAKNDVFSVILFDNAPLFDPTHTLPPDLTVHPMLRKPGGLGILMMQEFVDHLEYLRTPDGKNKLIFTKGGSHAI